MSGFPFGRGAHLCFCKCPLGLLLPRAYSLKRFGFGRRLLLVPGFGGRLFLVPGFDLRRRGVSLGNDALALRLRRFQTVEDLAHFFATPPFVPVFASGGRKSRLTISPSSSEMAARTFRITGSAFLNASTTLGS